MKLTNKDPEFYTIMGPVFGSREVQRKTGDRFYDDDQKEWYIELDETGEVTAVVSVVASVIKNVYGKDEAALLKILKEIYYIAMESIVPSVYAAIYRKAGYTIEEEGSLKKFIKIRGGNENGAIII